MKEKDEAQRVVVTGLGALTPAGLGVVDTWESLKAGRSGIDYLTSVDPTGYPCVIGGEVKGFKASDYIDAKAVKRMARFTQFAVVAAEEALSHAKLDLGAEDRDRIGVVLGNGNGGYPEIEEGARTLVEKGGMRMSPFFFPMSLPNIAAAQVSLTFGLRGPNTTIVTACASGTQAIGEAAELIRRGGADVVVTGGIEAGISLLGLGGFAVMRALSTSFNDQPKKASRPFDGLRDGFVPAEGGGILVLESLQHALKRDAVPLVEIAGYAATSDAYHVVAPDEDGSGAVKAMQGAIRDAGLVSKDVEYINAHGTSTPLNDRIETIAIKKVFGERASGVAISSTKSMLGHALGGAGGMEAIATVMTIVAGVIHPTINQEVPAPDCDLDYVPNESRKADVRVAMTNSFGFGGQNACVVMSRFE